MPFPYTFTFTFDDYVSVVWDVHVDWNNDGTFVAGEEINPDVKWLSWERGKSDELSRAMTGKCEIRVNNATGEYSPTNSGGSLYGSLLPRRPVRVRGTYEGMSLYIIKNGKIIEEWSCYKRVEDQQ